MNAVSASLGVDNSPSLGLWGDGDEIEAIDDVERTFGVRLDYSDAPNWATVGDVYRSLLAQLPAGADLDPDTWNRFTHAITEANGSDPCRVTYQSTLIERTNIWVQLLTLLRGWLR